MEDNGPRITKLCKALEKAVALTAKPLSRNDFIRLFPFATSPDLQEMLGAAYDEMHRQLLSRVEMDVTEICGDNHVVETLNRLDQLIVEDKILRSLGIEGMEDESENSPYVQLQQTTMEIKRQELRWLQNALKQEQELGASLSQKASQKQHELSAVLEKLNNVSHSFSEGTMPLRSTQQTEEKITA